jgi:hypothetical protein
MPSPSKRFDRLGGLRLHSLSACVALRAAGERFGYPELAQLLVTGRFCGISAGRLEQGQIRMQNEVLRSRNREVVAVAK